jgi:tetratricopeptide (TPR) repeat protein
MRRSLVRLAPIVLAVLATASAGIGASPQRWFEVRSAHFIVLTNASEKQARNTALQFERMRAVFHLLLPAASDDSDPTITVLTVKDRRDMRAFEPEQYLTKDGLDLSGFFLRAPDTNYIVVRLDADEEHAYATVYHEYTHYLLRKADGWLPLWLNEGLAQFYENTDVRSSNVQLGEPNVAQLQYLAITPMLPLATLFAVDARSPYYREEQKGTIFYAESWALTHLLILGDRTHGTHRIHDYAELLVHGEDPVTAARQAFGGLDTLQSQLSTYVRQPSLSFFTMKADLSPQDSTISLSPVPENEIDANRANILLYTGRTQEAQTLLDAVLRDDPNNELAHETAGYLRFQQGDYDGAKNSYSQAIALNSHSFLAHYYYAVMTLHGGDDTHDAAVESSLLKSIALNPQFAPSCDALAMFYASRRRNLDQAHILNLRAVELAPDSLGYRVDAAEVLAEQRQFADAAGILTAAEHLARTPSEIDSIERRIRRFEIEQATQSRVQARLTAEDKELDSLAK